MNETFSIKSTHSDRQLVFYEPYGEYFHVKLEGGIKASIRIYNYAPHAKELALWFVELGNHTAPWQGELSWESLEGEFKIDANCDSLGHIQFMISLSDMRGSNEESYIQVGIETELGQLESISAGAHRFFNV